MIIAVVVVIAAILIVYALIGTETPEPLQPSIQKPPATSSAEKVSETALPEATGNVDDSADALLQDSALETLASEEENSDADLLGADTQVISDFGQSYETSEF